MNDVHQLTPVARFLGMVWWWLRVSAAYPLASAVLLLSACAVDDTAVSRPMAVQYVGKIANSDALIALTIDADGLVAYSCGGPQTWQTHTSWFLPVDATVTTSTQGPSATLPPTASARGLTLAGTVDGQTAQGTLTLADGSVVPWQAQKVKRGSGAGLFVFEDTVERAGLIIAPDGTQAGVFSASTGDATSVSSPITTTVSPTSSGTVVTGTTTDATGGTTTLVLTLVSTTTSISIAQTGPIIVVLVHGVTGVGEQTRADKPAAENVSADLSALAGVTVNKPHPGSRLHGRAYWTAPFVAGLLGSSAKGALRLLGSGTGVAGSAFLKAATAVDINPTNGLTAPPPADCDLNDFITIDSETPVVVGKPIPPKRVVLLTHRDGKLSYPVQLRDTVDQVHRCVRLYEDRYGRVPTLVFVGHSGGGLMMRGIFSAPSRSALAGVFPEVGTTSFATWSLGTSSNPSTRDKMMYLRDRTLFGVTLCTPHEGGLFADWGVAARQKAGQLRSWLASGAAQGSLTDFGLNGTEIMFLQQIAMALSAGQVAGAIESPAAALQRLRVEVLKAYDQVLADQFDLNPITPQLNTARWQTMNQGPLAPATAARSAASPIAGAGGHLIPLYVAGARSAGTDILNTLAVPGMQTALTNLKNRQMPERAKFWMAGLTLTDQLTRTFGLLPAPAPGFASQLDRVRATGWLTEVTRLYQTQSVTVDATFRLMWTLSGGSALQAWLAYLNALQGNPIKQLQLDLPIYLSVGWTLELTEVPLNVPALLCKNASGSVLASIVLLDYPYVIEQFFKQFRTVDLAVAAFAGQGWDAFKANLAQNGSEAAQAASKLATDFAAALLRPDIAAIATCVQPANWSFGKLTQSAKVPLPVATNGSTSDGLVDFDGFVAIDSAVGLRLGTAVPGFFDHTRLDHVRAGAPSPGSWYRLFASPMDRMNHEIQRFETGQWISAQILGANPGPIPSQTGSWSVYP
jgi:hypothetical protein